MPPRSGKKRPIRTTASTAPAVTIEVEEEVVIDTTTDDHSIAAARPTKRIKTTTGTTPASTTSNTNHTAAITHEVDAAACVGAAAAPVTNISTVDAPSQIPGVVGNSSTLQTNSTVGVETNSNASTHSILITPSTSTTTNSPFIPHGILKLPQSVASTLASDFLEKIDIRDLGVTCRWMLVSLNQCEIHEPISLKSALRRAKRQASSSDPTKKVTTLRTMAARVPNLFIGKLRNIVYSRTKMPLDDFRILREMGRLNDVQHLFLQLKYLEPSDLRCPLALPPHLVSLSLHETKSVGLLDFILPSTLQRVYLDDSFSFYLNEIQWPQSGHLKELINLYDSVPLDGLLLPEGVQTLTFDWRMSQPITNLTLPNSITNLQIGRWTNNGCYHDLVFPPLLQRLVLTVDYEKGDLDLTKWTGLPISCQNLALIVRGPEKDIVVHTAPPPIVIPSWVKQLRVYRAAVSPRPRSFQPSPMPSLNLTQATALVSLLTDSVDLIQWPFHSSSLVKLHLQENYNGDSGHHLWFGVLKQHSQSSTSPFPDTLVELNLVHTCVPSRYQLTRTDPILPYQKLGHIIFPPSLRCLKLPEVTASPNCPNLLPWSLASPACLIEGRCYHMHDSTYSKERVTHGRDYHLRHYQNGVLIDEAILSRLEYEETQRKDKKDKQAYDLMTQPDPAVGRKLIQSRLDACITRVTDAFRLNFCRFY